MSNTQHTHTSTEQQDLFELIENTQSHVFITGKAGTGKSTFIEQFRTRTKKNIAVIAPTGVAALNIKGQTIHSFFGFRHHVHLDAIRKKYGKRAKLYRELDAIVIDEVSMVRADLFDCIERFMRLNGPDKTMPFGGVQLILAGDLYQLPPIVSADERDYFERMYASPFFFDSNAYQQVIFKKVTLTKVFRQSDEHFIGLLDRLRTCAFTQKDIDTINTRVAGGYQKPKDEFVISLVTRNATADAINKNELAKLDAKASVYKSKTEGEFREKDFPTSHTLTLKEGSQVMLLNNHPKGTWVNGDIVKIAKIHNTHIDVLFDDGRVESVRPHRWEAVRFSFDEIEERIETDIVGTFSQLPVRLAWAVTIHKSQGKTFDKVHIHLGGGAFASGQTYVALSRCRSLSGIFLETPIEQRDLFIDDRIRKFME